jgi:hypothetical protein
MLFVFSVLSIAMMMMFGFLVFVPVLIALPVLALFSSMGLVLITGAFMTASLSLVTAITTGVVDIILSGSLFMTPFMAMATSFILPLLMLDEGPGLFVQTFFFLCQPLFVVASLRFILVIALVGFAITGSFVMLAFATVAAVPLSVVVVVVVAVSCHLVLVLFII